MDIESILIRFPFTGIYLTVCLKHVFQFYLILICNVIIISSHINYYIIKHVKKRKKLMCRMLNYAHNKMALLYGKNRPRKLVKRALRENDFLSYAVHAQYGPHFKISFAYLQRVSISFAARPCARKNYSSFIRLSKTGCCATN